MNIEFPWNEPDFLEAWKEWTDFRKERKLPKYVPTGLQKTLTMLKKISGESKSTAIAIINQSIEQNYQGLFPLKQTNGTHQSSTNSSKLGTSDARIATAKKW